MYLILVCGRLLLRRRNRRSGSSQRFASIKSACFGSLEYAKTLVIMDLLQFSLIDYIRTKGSLH